MGSSVMRERASLLKLFAANAAFKTSLSRVQSGVLNQMMLSFEGVGTQLNGKRKSIADWKEKEYCG